MTITFCKTCEGAFEDEESNAHEPSQFCGKGCEEMLKNGDLPNFCQQCFNGYARSSRTPRGGCGIDTSHRLRKQLEAERAKVRRLREALEWSIEESDPSPCPYCGVGGKCLPHLVLAELEGA